MATTKTLTATNQTITIPEFTEKPDARQYSDGESKLADAVNSNTQAIANNEAAMAYIVGNTNTTGSTLAVGQFVYVKGHSTIAEGLRTVTASISANGNITTSNTSACSEGGLNALNSKLTPQYEDNTATTDSDGDIDLGTAFSALKRLIIAAYATSGTHYITPLCFGGRGYLHVTNASYQKEATTQINYRVIYLQVR